MALKKIWIVFVITVVSFYGCKKTTIINTDNDQPTNYHLIRKANNWLDQMEKIATNSDKSILASLRSNLLYTDVTIQRFDNNYQLLIIPVNKEFTSNIISKVETKKYLVIKCNTLTTKGGFFIEITNQGNNSSKIKQLQFKNFLNAEDHDFDGQVTFSTIYQKFLFEHDYINGKLSKTKYLFAKRENEVKIKNSTIGKNSTTCTDWFWMYYLNGVFIGEIYAYTTCKSDNCLAQTTQIGDNRNIIIKASCHDTGGTPGNTGGAGLVDTIKNNLTTICFISAFNKLFNTSTLASNRLSGFLNQTFGLNTKFKLSVNELPFIAPQPGSPAGSIVYASIDPATGVVRTPDGGLDITVNLNQSTLQNASQELVAMVILHEATHGFLFAQGIDYRYHHAGIYIERLQNEMATIVYELYKDNTSNSLQSLNSLSSDLIHSTPQSTTTQQYATGNRGKKCQ